MLELADFLVELEAGLPSGWVDEHLTLGVTHIELVLPIEARLVGVGVELSTPRGRLDTGFGVEHGRVRLNFTRGDLVTIDERGGSP